MKKIILLIVLSVSYINVFSQIIADQYFYPIPRIVDSTYLVTTCNFATSVVDIDSLVINKYTNNNYPNSFSIYIYAYYNCEGWATPSTLTDTFNLSPYVDSIGFYRIKLYTYCTSNLNYVVDSTMQNINVISSSQEITFNKSSFIIYPNPINNNSAIYSSEIIKYIEIYDVSGMLLFRRNINKELYYLNMTKYKKGLYFTKIKTNKGIITKKIIVK